MLIVQYNQSSPPALIWCWVTEVFCFCLDGTQRHDNYILDISFSGYFLFPCMDTKSRDCERWRVPEAANVIYAKKY